MNALRRLVPVSMLSVVFLSLLSSGASGAPQGVIVLAESSGKTMTYHDPDSPIPANPAGEIHEAYSFATADSGPSGHSLSSIAWPGSTAANGGDALGFPSYPVRAEAFYPKGPKREENAPTPSTKMEAQATESLIAATTVSGEHKSEPPGPAARVLKSSARTVLEKDTVMSEATSTVKDISILDDLVKIGSVVTQATVTSDGVKSRVAGKTKITGVTVADQKATIDEKGIHLGDQTVEVPDVFGEEPVKDALAQAGITIKLGRAKDSGRGASATRELGGLVVRFEAGALWKLMKPLPDEVKREVKKNVDFNKAVVFRFGSVVVSAVANQTLDLPEPPIPPAQSLTEPLGAAPPPGSGAAPPPNLGGGLPATEPPAGSEPNPDSRPVAASAPLETHPLPAILLGLTLTGVLVGTGAFRRLADAVIAGGGSCPHDHS